MKFKDWNQNNMTNKIKKLTCSFILFTILTFSLAGSGFMCKKNDVTPPLDTTSKKQNQYIQFVKHGEFYFQDKNKNLIKKINIEIAETDEKRHLGLMFRDKLGEDDGMLFIFPDEEEQGFYMKNTMIPLDIMFINSQKKIVKIYKNTTPYSEKTLPSGQPIKYVIEVNGGFSDKYNIKEGDYTDWRRN